MHVVHLTASTFYGGPERQMVGLARALAGSHATSFLTFAESGWCGAFLSAARSNGFPALALEHDTPNLRAMVREIAAFLASTRADFLCCHGFKANLLGRVAARRCRLPAIAVSRGWTGENLKVQLYEALDRWHMRWMDRVVCVSQAQAHKVRRTGVSPERMRVIANAVDPERFGDPDPGCRAELLGFFPRSPTHLIGAAGRLSPEKGFDVLIAAAARVAAADPSVGFLHFGEGPCRPALQQQIESAGLGGRFILGGFRNDLDRFLPVLDLFVLPSFTEGMPNVVLEAFAAGVPVVATAVGGTPELIEDSHSGLLVPPGDSAALAAKIIQALASPDRANELRLNARRRVREHFTFAAQARQYAQLFVELAGASPKGTRPTATPSLSEKGTGPLIEGSCPLFGQTQRLLLKSDLHPATIAVGHQSHDD